MSKSDTELMLEFRDTGREEAFAELVQRYKVPLLEFFFRLTWDRQVSEDCCQEVFCRVFRHRKRYEPTATFATFLYRIGRNLWIDRFRSARTAPNMVSLDGDTDTGGDTVGSMVPARGDDPSHRLELRDEVARVKRALRSLAPELRETLVLVKYQGLKYQEAAEVLGVPMGTVRSRIHAAIEQLRRLLRISAPAAGLEDDNGN